MIRQQIFPKPYQAGDVPTADLWDVPAGLSMIPHAERSLGGGDLLSYGKNGGVENFDTVQYNISNNNNSASTSVNSQADTTNIITFDKNKSAPMYRSRYAC